MRDRDGNGHGSWQGAHFANLIPNRQNYFSSVPHPQCVLSSCQLSVLSSRSHCILRGCFRLFALLPIRRTYVEVSPFKSWLVARELQQQQHDVQLDIYLPFISRSRQANRMKRIHTMHARISLVSYIPCHGFYCSWQSSKLLWDLISTYLRLEKKERRGRQAEFQGWFSVLEKLLGLQEYWK